MSIFKNKWFGRSLMLVLACFMFLSLKDSVAAKADGEAQVKLIYGNWDPNAGVDEHGDPIGDFTENPNFSFAGGEGRAVYAVYITPAEGTAITIEATDPSKLNYYEAVKYANIWVNNCQVKITGTDFIDPNFIFLAGNTACVDVGWTHYVRSGAPEVDTFNALSADASLATILDHFTSRIIDDDPEVRNYMTEMEVTVDVDTDITWDWYVNRLTLSNGVTLTIKANNTNDQGRIFIENALILGDNSTIIADASVDYPCLEFSFDAAVDEKLVLYDFDGPTGPTPLSSDKGGPYIYTARNFAAAGQPDDTRIIWTKAPTHNPDNQDPVYWIEYNNNDALIKVNSSDIIPWNEYTYTAGDSLTITYEAPEGITAPYKAIWWYDDDPGHTTQDLVFSNGSSTITPDGTRFGVMIWWTEDEYIFYQIQPESDQFAVDINLHGSDSMTFTVTAKNSSNATVSPVNSYSQSGNVPHTKYVYPNTATQLVITVTGTSEYDLIDHFNIGESDVVSSLTKNGNNYIYTFTGFDTTESNDQGDTWPATHFIDIACRYDGPGSDPGEGPVDDPTIVDDAKKYLYAYAMLDYDKDADTDEDDLKLALAYDLYAAVLGGPREGMYNMPGDDASFESIISFIAAERITNITEDGSITAKKADGTSATLTRYKATIDWSSDISGDVYLYILPDADSFLISTSFNESTGTGENGYYFLRSDPTDRKRLTADAEAGTLLDAHVIITDKINNVVFGSHGRNYTVRNINNNLFTLSSIPSNNPVALSYKANGGVQDITTTFEIKVLKADGKYFVTESRGENKKYDFVSDSSGRPCDQLWEAGTTTPVKVFIHDTELHIKPLSTDLGVTNVAITGVSLKNPALANAVTINKDNTDDIVITFISNFYDTVEFTIAYADGTSKDIKVEREGMIVQYTGLDRNNSSMEWKLDLYDQHGKTFTYDYRTEQVVIMATYYHSSKVSANDLSLVVTYADGSIEVISHADSKHGFDGYMSGSSYNAVDTTTFIIGFMTNAEAESTHKFRKEGHASGPISIQVINTGSDSANNFGGAFVGSGKGKDWDGVIDYKAK